jgi:hypothetical protein
VLTPLLFRLVIDDLQRTQGREALRSTTRANRCTAGDPTRRPDWETPQPRVVRQDNVRHHRQPRCDSFRPQLARKVLDLRTTQDYVGRHLLSNESERRRSCRQIGQQRAQGAFMVRLGAAALPWT